MKPSHNSGMSRMTGVIAWLLLLILVGLEPALANKFETIGGGVSGFSGEKMQVLKQISIYSGGFFLLLGVLALLSRNRFEGFVGYSSRKEKNKVPKGALVLAVIGSILVLLGFL